MVHEAQKAGVHFDTDRLRDLHCIDDQLSDFEWAQRGRAPGNGNGNGNGRPNSLNPGPPIPRISIEVDPTDQPAAPSAPPAMARPSAFRSPSYESGAPSPTQGNVGAGARPGVMRSESFEPPQPRVVAPVMEVEPPMSAEKSQFLLRLEASATTGLVHDCLEWNGGLGFAGTAAWKGTDLLLLPSSQGSCCEGVG